MAQNALSRALPAACAVFCVVPLWDLGVFLTRQELKSENIESPNFTFQRALGGSWGNLASAEPAPEHFPNTPLFVEK